ncbi:IS3 family transposase, partial [Lactococcus cremoris]|uniref:IS3 family transposase n=1 Tax=Lactococcus lactis subsp. cremoris TaxID=1359 RepID=UPI00062A5017
GKDSFWDYETFENESSVGIRLSLTDRESYKNFEEAYQSIFWYIEAFYNSKRIHQSLGYLTPNQFEKVSA